MAHKQPSLEYLRDILWDPEIIKLVYPKCVDDDVQIFKASVMLQSVLVLFGAMRKEQIGLAKSLETLSQERKEMLLIKTNLEIKVEHLEVECSQLRRKLEDAEGAGSAALIELKRLQEQLAQKVDERAQSIFLSCLKKNRGTTVMDWMTQLNQESQFLNCEGDIKINRFDGEASDSPDIIDSTPEQKRTLRKGKKKMCVTDSSQNFVEPQENTKPATISRTPISKQIDFPFSPDEIACTPNAKRQPHFALKFAQSDSNTNQSQKPSFPLETKSNGKVCVKKTDTEVLCAVGNNLVLSLDTQEMDMQPVVQSHGGEFLEIPETFYPDDYEMEIKEFCKALDSKIDTKEDLPTTTPEKKTTEDNGSPILGSGSKVFRRKSSQNSPASDSLSLSLLGEDKSSLKNSTVIQKNDQIARRYLCLDMNDFVLEKDGKGGKKRQTKLSLSKPKRVRDISQSKEFIGGQCSGPLKNISDITKLSEEQRIQLAIQASLDDNQTERNFDKELNDTDITFFDPKGMGEECVQHAEVEEQTRIGGNNSSIDPCFQPMFASTAKFPALKEIPDPPPNSNKTSGKDVSFKLLKSSEDDQTQFNPICNSTEKQVAGNSELTQFNPISTSTEKGPTENSPLEHLIGLLDAEPVAPRESSFHRPPKKNSTSPNYKYQGKTVRKKAERMKLPAWDCPDCRDFNRMAGFDPDNPETKHLLRKCSRHRSKHGNRQATPEGYWEPDWVSPKGRKTKQ